MNKQSRAAAGLVAAVCLSVAAGAQTHKAMAMATHATGTFDVKIIPLAAADKAADPTLARMSIDKQFHGDLDGTSKGQMLTAGTDVKDSAGYVAIECVTGTLQGRSGSVAPSDFALAMNASTSSTSEG